MWSSWKFVPSTNHDLSCFLLEPCGYLLLLKQQKTKSSRDRANKKRSLKRPLPKVVDRGDLMPEAIYMSSSSDGSSLPSTSYRHEYFRHLSARSSSSSSLCEFPPKKAGEASPNSTCRQRKLSIAIISDKNADHKILEGRPKLHFPISERPRTSSQDLMIPSRMSLSKRQLSETSSSSSLPELDYTLFPPPLRLSAWAEVDATQFVVRGPQYLMDGVKIPSENSVFSLLTVDFVKVDVPIYNGLCSQPNERIQQALQREAQFGIKELPDYTFAVNLCIPGSRGGYFHWVAYFGLNDISAIQDTTTPLGRLAQPFFFGSSDRYRDATFKLIPQVLEGNFIVKKAVGSQPTILGRKLKQYYIQHDRFFEIVVDIGSNPVAQRIVKLVLGYAKSLVVDMMFLLEGASNEYLPERILGGARINYLDPNGPDGERECAYN